ncbi:MAG: HD domain-containing phosphohydrolase [Ilumatobacteraceae bacterium]
MLRATDILFHPPFPGAVHDLLTRFTSGVVFFGSAALCVARGSRAPNERSAWWALASGFALWGAGDLYQLNVLVDRSSVSYPSIADGLWLAFYVPAYAAIISLMRKQAGSVPRAFWLDALIGGLGVGGAAAAVAFGVVVENSNGTVAATVTNVAYPVGDIGLLALVVVAITVTGWRVKGVLRQLAPAFAIFVLADAIYVVQTDKGTLGWSLAALLVGIAAQRETTVAPHPRRNRTGSVLPALSGLAALALLVMDHFARTNLLALTLATASILLILFRQWLAMRENRRLLDQSRREATTDALTGLGNRRQLTADLAAHLPHLDPARPLTLTMFDLDGFKGYNDTFGHPAGDQLLERLATRLKGVVAGRGTAYRMGGDEFCTLWTSGAGDHATGPSAEVVAALSEHGDAFSVRASHGSVTLPTDTSDPETALRIADREMYLCKRSGRASAGRQSVDVLHRVLAERAPALGDHLDTVADLVSAMTTKLRLAQGDCDLALQTALLHDIGKVAIPDSILNKPGPLDPTELAFMRQHTIIGERIITAAPALSTVAKLVRATHERYDGDGYPDGVAGDNIPLIARIVSVCDAYDAMTTARSHPPARHRADAIVELRRCSGTQFDPAAVEMLVGVLEDDLNGPARASDWRDVSADIR